MKFQKTKEMERILKPSRQKKVICKGSVCLELETNEAMPLIFCKKVSFNSEFPI